MKAKKLKDLEYVKEFYGYNNAKAKTALDILSDEQISVIKRRLYKGGKNGRDQLDTGTDARNWVERT